MKVSRLSGFIATVLLSLWSTGCGDTFRPVVNPFSPPLPEPAAHGLAVTVNSGGLLDGSTTCVNASAPPCPAGSVTQINVSGDTPAANPQPGGFGQTPVHATFVPSGANTFARAVIANKSSDNVSVYTPDSTVQANLVSLGTGAQPVFVLATANGSKVYVANFGNSTIGVVSPLASPPVLAATIDNAGSQPKVMTESADGSKIYVANEDGSISVIPTATNPATVSVKVSSISDTPMWIATNPAGNAVYVLYHGATDYVAILDPGTDSFLSTTVNVSTGSNYMVFDSNLQRLYVSGGSSVSVLNAATQVPSLVKNVTIPNGSVAMTVLRNGSSIYVGTGSTDGCASEADHGRAYVVNAASLADPDATSCITVGASPVWMASSADSLKVYVAHQGTSPGTTVIAGTTRVAEIAAPFTDPNCDPETATCFKEQPVFVMANR